MAQFRARARTVDMLGRQQIAGIPTAISELFKNAHDAYATQVLVDFYRPEQLFVLRDNGLGMTVQDIMEKWLVLGTESKLAGHDELAPVASALNLPTRRPTGEKGIGRLAIAAIGPQLLLLTRAKRLDGMRPTVAAFINWSLFALPRISLDEIDIPVKEFPHGALPAAEDIADMVKVVQRNLNRIRHRVSQSDASEIDAQLNRVSFDPAALQGRFQGGALEGAATGTQFYVQPTDAMLELALDAAPERRRIGDLQKTLMGFTNTMIPDGDEPPIQAEFRDHLSLDFHQSVIGRAEFFTPAEFKAADHHFRGVFSVRLQSATGFPLVRLDKAAANKEFDLVVQDEGDQWVHLKIPARLACLIIVTFCPGSNPPGEVMASGESGAYCFRSADGEDYRWIADMKDEHALKAAGNLAAALSRPGPNDSEWQRRSGRS